MGKFPVQVALTVATASVPPWDLTCQMQLVGNPKTCACHVWMWTGALVHMLQLELRLEIGHGKRGQKVSLAGALLFWEPAPELL